MAQLTDIDRDIIRYADTLSPAAISFKVAQLHGITIDPSAIQARIQVLLDTPDWLSGVQQDQLVTQKMRIIISELEEMPRTTRNAEVIINALDKVGARLDKRTAATENELHTFYAFQAEALVDAISASLAYIASKAKNPEVRALMEAHTETALRHAQIELERHDTLNSDYQSLETVEASE